MTDSIESTVQQGARDAFALVTLRVLDENIASHINELLEVREGETPVDREIRVRGLIATLASLTGVMARNLAKHLGAEDPLFLVREAILTLERGWNDDEKKRDDGQHRQ